MLAAPEIIERPALTQVTTEIKGHVIVYDLPCETRKAYEDAATDQKEDRQELVALLQAMPRRKTPPEESKGRER